MLRPTGPWLLFASSDELGFNALNVSNQDGSGLTRLSQFDVLPSGDLSSLASSRGARIAYYSAPDPRTWCVGTELNIVDLSTGISFDPLPLLHAGLAPSVSSNVPLLQCEQSDPALAAISWADTLAWSPQSDQLAFVGAAEPPNADLYMFSLSTGKAIRLTSGKYHATRPEWSPDAKYIVYGEISRFIFPSDFEYGLPVADWDSIWIVPARGGAPKLLYSLLPFDRKPEAIVGWLTNTRYLADSRNDPWCGYTDLRVVDVESSSTSTIRSDAYVNRAFAQRLGLLLISVPNEPLTEQCKYSAAPGLYLVSALTGETKKVSDQASDSAWWGDIVWSETASLFFVSTPSGPVAVAPSGELIEIGPRATGEMWPAPNGTYVVTRPIDQNDGWIFSVPFGRPPSQLLLSSGRIDRVAWSPDSSMFSYFPPSYAEAEDRSIMVFSVPEMISIRISPGVPDWPDISIRPVWVAP